MNQLSESRYLNFNINYMAIHSEEGYSHSEEGYTDTIYPLSLYDMGIPIATIKMVVEAVVS